MYVFVASVYVHVYDARCVCVCVYVRLFCEFLCGLFVFVLLVFVCVRVASVCVYVCVRVASVCVCVYVASVCVCVSVCRCVVDSHVPVLCIYV